ncbi:MAG: S-layer homology domain-containing protein [Peptococcaceae bacterium]|nr:S-layer homology domain-containing protein [Peptococcaceae bacterium]
MKRLVLLGLVLFFAMACLMGVMASGVSPTSNDVAVYAEPGWLALEPTRNGPIKWAGGTKYLVGYADHTAWVGEDGKLHFDFRKGADGLLYGFQPGSYYEFDMLFKIINKRDENICVSIDVENMGAYREYILIGAQKSWTLEKEFTPGDHSSFPWPNKDKERQIAAGDHMWVLVHFDIPPDAESLGPVSGKMVIRARACDEDTGGNGGRNGKPPSVDGVPDGVFIARWPGHIPLVTRAVKLEEPKPEFTADITADPETLAEARAKGLEPRVYIWNENFHKWVALASYPQPDGTVKAINDGNYTGWTAVFAVRQPRFIDLTPTDWYEPVLNRANGLALIEGHPADPWCSGSLARLAKPHAQMTRAEYVVMVTRALGLVHEEEQKMHDVLQYVPSEQVNAVLQGRFSDAGKIPAWCRKAIATAVNSGLLDGVGGMETEFGPSVPVTRVQAAVIASSALAKVPGYGFKPADLSLFKDAAEVPSWAVGKVAQGVLVGNSDGTLGPNNPITRAETYTVFLRLLRGLGW